MRCVRASTCSGASTARCRTDGSRWPSSATRATSNGVIRDGKADSAGRLQPRHVAEAPQRRVGGSRNIRSRADSAGPTASRATGSISSPSRVRSTCRCGRARKAWSASRAGTARSSTSSFSPTTSGRKPSGQPHSPSGPAANGIAAGEPRRSHVAGGLPAATEDGVRSGDATISQRLVLCGRVAGGLVRRGGAARRRPAARSDAPSRSCTARSPTQKAPTSR